MNKLALMLAATSTFVLGAPASAAMMAMETVEAKATASSAVEQARADMFATFGQDYLEPGKFLWRDGPAAGEARVVVSLSDQLAFLYRGDSLVAVSTISSGKPGKETPTGIFPVMEKKKFHRSRKYDDAPMPFMQRIDQYGIALHGGHLPGHPASHGCVRLPQKFAARLFSVTEVGTPVLIGA